MEIFITKIQRFCFNDGPGIRTVVFCKGCTLQCPWCCNPETKNPYPEIFFNKNLCLRTKGIDCKECLIQVSDPEDYLKIKIDYKVNYKLLNEICPVEALGIYGKKINLSELVEILKKDEVYFRMTGGGVTFSGGEPLLNDLFFWFKQLKLLDFNICVETSLYVPSENLKKIFELVDVFIVDLKILSFNEARRILKGDLNLFIENVNFLMRHYSGKVLFRFPVVKEITYTEKNLKLLVDFINSFNVKYLEIFSVHNLGKEKYYSLGLNYNEYSLIPKDELEKLKNFIEKQTLCNVSIIEF
jgi:pyruvate formate lyase activating enzyme